MKIGLDFDGVIANPRRLMSQQARKLYGVNVAPGKFKKEIVVGENHLTASQYSDIQNTVYRTREFGLQLDVVNGVLDYLPRLDDEDYTLTIITSRDKEALEIAKEWSAGHGLELDFIGVGPGSKAEAAQGVDIYVDDDLDKIEPLVDIVEHRFLFTWGYNQHLDPAPVAKRVSSWPELFGVIQKLSEDALEPRNI